MRRLTALFIYALLLGNVAVFCQAEMKIDPLVAGPASGDVIYVLSPAGGHVAAGMMKGSRFAMAVDGLEGPKVDSVMNVLPAVGVLSPPDPRSALPSYTPKPINPTPIVFSDDGKRFAYLARLGQEYIVYLDGQEHRRFPVASANQIRMQFTGSDAKHFMLATSNNGGAFDLWVDGQQKPAYPASTVPIISRDGTRYAYQGVGEANQPGPIILDGQPSGYSSYWMNFTGDGKSLLALRQVNNDHTVLLDGKPVVTSAGPVRVTIAPKGSKFVTVISKPANGAARFVCVADGQEIAATDAQSEPFVVFSPDGTRWAARCRNITGAPISWVVADDGKKQQEYIGIDEASLCFSSDAKHLAYVAGAGSKAFPVIDGQEAEGFDYNAKVGFSPDGKTVFFGGRQDQPQVSRLLVVNGKQYRGDHNFNNESIAFSPDGSRWGVLGSGLKSGGPTGLQSVANFILDGKLVEGVTVDSFVF